MNMNKRDDYQEPALRGFKRGEYEKILQLMGEGSKWERKNAEIINCANDEFILADIAHNVQTTEQDAASVIKAFNARGLWALRNKPRTITRYIVHKILVAHRANPRNLGYDFDKWTLRALKNDLAVRENINISQETLRKVIGEAKENSNEKDAEPEKPAILPSEGQEGENCHQPGRGKGRRKTPEKGDHESKVKVIRLRLMGYKKRRIADEVGVHPSTVYRWLLPFKKSKDPEKYLARLQILVEEKRRALEESPRLSVSRSRLPNRKGDRGNSKMPASRKSRLLSISRMWNDFLEAYPGRIESIGEKGSFLLRPDQFQKRDWLSFRHSFDFRPSDLKVGFPDIVLHSKKFTEFIAEKERQIHALSQDQNPKVQAILKTWYSKDEGATFQRLQDTFLFGLLFWNASIINWFIKELNERQKENRHPSPVGRPADDWLNFILLFFDNELMRAYKSGDPNLRLQAVPYKKKPHLKDIAVLFHCLFTRYIRDGSPRTIFNRLRHLRLKGLNHLFLKKGYPVGVDLHFTPPLRSLSEEGPP